MLERIADEIEHVTGTSLDVNDLSAAILNEFIRIHMEEHEREIVRMVTGYSRQYDEDYEDEPRYKFNFFRSGNPSKFIR